MRYLVLALAFATAAQGCSDRPPADSAADTSSLPVTAPSPPPPGGDNPPQEGSTAVVPVRFQGRWAADAAACASAGHESHLTIGADRIRFHESSGTVTSAMSSGSDLTLVASLSGEGQTRGATYRFRLSDDGNMLTDMSSGMSMVRYRC